MSKYFTIVIKADDESAARSLVPGEIIRGNRITTCSLGDVIALNEKLRELIPEEMEEKACAEEVSNISAFLHNIRPAVTPKPNEPKP